MNPLAWIAIVALGALTVFVVGDLLDPGSVPVAETVELTGTAPQARPPAEGFFIVPPRVVDLRDQDAADDGTPPNPSDGGGSGGFDGASSDDGRDDVEDDGSPDAPDDSDGGDDSPDEPDDSVDDDD